MDQKLIEAAARAAKRKVTLLLENEPSCNTATGLESKRTLNAVRSPNFKLNWDAGNAASRGEIAYPDGYSHLPKDRIGYMHCKDVVRGAGDKYEWMKMGGGIIDYVGQFRAQEGRLPRRREFGNALARRGHAGRIEPAEHGGDERFIAARRRALSEIYQEGESSCLIPTTHAEIS